MGVSFSVMVYELDQKTIVNDFASPWMLNSSDLGTN